LSFVGTSLFDHSLRLSCSRLLRLQWRSSLNSSQYVCHNLYPSRYNFTPVHPATSRLNQPARNEIGNERFEVKHLALEAGDGVGERRQQGQSVVPTSHPRKAQSAQRNTHPCLPVQSSYWQIETQSHITPAPHSGRPKRNKRPAADCLHPSQVHSFSCTDSSPSLTGTTPVARFLAYTTLAFLQDTALLKSHILHMTQHVYQMVAGMQSRTQSTT